MGPQSGQALGVPLEAARACLQCARENKRVVVRAETQAHSTSPDEGHRPPSGSAVEALAHPQDVPLACPSHLPGDPQLLPLPGGAVQDKGCRTVTSPSAAPNN